MDLVRYYLDPDAGADPRLLGGLDAATVLDLGDGPTPTSSTWRTWVFGSVSAQRQRLGNCTGGEPRMFADLWPGFDADGCRSGRSPAACTDPPGWPRVQHLTDPDSPSADAVYRELTAGKIWNQRNELRADLVDEVRRRAFTSGRDCGSPTRRTRLDLRHLRPRRAHDGFARRNHLQATDADVA